MNVNFLRTHGDAVRLTASKTEKTSFSGDVYSRIVQVLLYVVAVALPLFYLPFTSSVLEYNKQVLLVAVASVGLVVWLLGVVVSGTLTVRRSPIDKGVWALLLATVLATAFSIMRAKSIFGISTSLSSSLLSVAALSVLYFLAVNTLHDRGRMLRSALSLSAVCALALGLAQMLAIYVLPGEFTHSRAFTTVGSLNTLGILAAIVLPLFAKTTARSGRIHVVLATVGAMLAILVLAILNWWVLWCVALAGMLAIIAFDSLNASVLAQEYGPRAKRWALSRFMIPMTVVVVGAFLLLVQFSPASLKSKFPVEVTPSYRLSWDIAKHVLHERPIFGYGPENYSIAFDRFGAHSLANTKLSSLRFYDATSEALTVAVHGGGFALAAGLLLLWCLVQSIARFGGAISESAARGENASFAIEASGTLAATVAATVAVCVYPFSLTLLFVWYGLLALTALIIAGNRASTVDIESRPMYSLSASLGFIIGLIAVLSAAYFTSVMYLADVQYGHALTQTEPEKVRDGINRAISLRGNNDRYLRDASQVALLLLRKELATKGNDAERTQRIQEFMQTAVQDAQRATQVAPLESLNWNNLGLVYQAMSGLVENVEQLAEQAFTKAAELRPGDPSFDNQVGQMWLARVNLIRQVGKDDPKYAPAINDALVHAEDAFNRSIAIAPSFGRAIYNLGAVYDRQGKVAEAISQLEKIAPYNANDPTLMFELGLLYVRANRHPDAVTALQRAILLAPNFANARWYLALLLEEKGDINGAISQLQEIQKTNPDNATLQQKIEQLQAGQRAIPPAKVIDSQPLE